MIIEPADAWKLLAAVLVGGIIGFEREFRDKAAGFRTLIFICLGSTLFTLLSVKLAQPGDPTRIAANIVAGVGFLGAGVIMRDNGRVLGLTTAAAVWLVAALGMGIGAGEYAAVALATVISSVVLWIFPGFERWVNRLRDERAYEITCFLGDKPPLPLEELVGGRGLQVLRGQHVKQGERITYTFRLVGHVRAHDALVKQLLADSRIEALRY